MSDLSLDSLLEQLKRFPSGTPLQDAMSAVRAPEQPDLVEARKRCALVRWFDEAIYDFLCDDWSGKPDFEDFLQISDIERLAPGKWVVEASERARLLTVWQSDPAAYRDENSILGSYFAQLTGPEMQLCAVYHLAASRSPETVTTHFSIWYSDADKRFDMAQCNALLEMLRLQESWRGSSVSQLWHEYRRYYSARILFVDDYYKTGSYFERAEVLSSFLSVLNRGDPDNRWIFHVHANGGTGKTMFLRWLTARYLVPLRIPCARVDFDDFRLDEMVSFPLRMVTRIIDQWSQQPQGASLSPLLEKLRREEQTTGWNRSIMDEVRRQLQGSSITSNIVVMLDTLEEATLSAASWLVECIKSLREIQMILPKLTLVLSGRYDIAARSTALLSGEFVNYELPRFTEAEAHAYLASRRIDQGPVRDAIVARAGSDENAESDSDQLAGRNPFKLSMFAELALNREHLTADDVMRFPRADIAYLIERVIKRIESQPLRWIIRYGAIARHLTPEFTQAVLLPPLLTALRGTNTDEPQKGLDEYRDVWKPDSVAADDLEQNGISTVWAKLSSYARDRGWLSRVNIESRTELRFHPEVIKPTRDLLRDQPIFNELQQRSAEFFERRAKEAGSTTEEDIAHSVRYMCEAVFHRFQEETEDAEAYWIQALRQAERFGPAAAMPVATEILGREYAQAERFPYSRVSSPRLLIRAHCEAADLFLQRDLADVKHFIEFRRHIELALLIAGDNAYLGQTIPPLLRTIYMAASPGAATTASVLRAAIPFAECARDRFFLAWELGKLLVTQADSEAAGILRQALQLFDKAHRTSISAVDISLKLASLYQFQGIHAAVVETFRSARETAGDDERAMARVLDREISYFLAVGDLATAENRLALVLKFPQEIRASAAAEVKEARIALAKLDPFAALGAISRARTRSLSEKDRARCFDQEGEAHALLFEFKAALDSWDFASSHYDQSGDPVGSSRCALLAAALTAQVMGDYASAETHLASAFGLRGSYDIEVLAELRLLQAFVDLRKNRRQEAVETLRKWFGRPDLTPRIRARVLMFALVFGFESSDGFYALVVESLGEIQPISLRDNVLEWAAYSDELLSVPRDVVAQLMGQFSRPAFESPHGARLLIQRADLYRLFGMKKEAEAELARAPDTGLLLGWRLCLARERLGLHARYGALLRSFKGSEFESTPLCTALLIGAISEAIQESDLATAHQLSDKAPLVVTDLPVSWQDRLATVLNTLSPPAPSVQVAKESRSIGPPRIESRSEERFSIVTITETDLPPSWRLAVASVDLAVDLLFGGMPGGWLGMKTEMTAVLRQKEALHRPIEFVGGISALPWEFARIYCRRSSKVIPFAYTSESLNRPGAIVVVRSEESQGEISYAIDSGSSIEQVYFGYGVKPHVLFDWQADQLGTFAAEPPTLVHIVATIREASSGSYLDFSGSSRRAASLGLESSGREISLTAFRLDRMLASLPKPPFVILDMGQSYNQTETVRMLLLRNLFATQLFELGHVRGILGCGLAPPTDRLLLASGYLKSLIDGPVVAALDSLRDEPSGAAWEARDLDYIVPRLGAALWANWPEDRLFEP